MLWCMYTLWNGYQKLLSFLFVCVCDNTRSTLSKCKVYNEYIIITTVTVLYFSLKKTYSSYNWKFCTVCCSFVLDYTYSAIPSSTPRILPITYTCSINQYLSVPKLQMWASFIKRSLDVLVNSCTSNYYILLSYSQNTRFLPIPVPNYACWVMLIMTCLN